MRKWIVLLVTLVVVLFICNRCYERRIITQIIDDCGIEQGQINFFHVDKREDVILFGLDFKNEHEYELFLSNLREREIFRPEEDSMMISTINREMSKQGIEVEEIEYYFLGSCSDSGRMRMAAFKEGVSYSVVFCVSYL